MKTAREFYYETMKAVPKWKGISFEELPEKAQAYWEGRVDQYNLMAGHPGETNPKYYQRKRRIPLGRLLPKNFR